MSIHINDLKDLKLYRGSNKLFIPLDDKDNKHGSLIYLLTADIQSSINMINSNMLINRNWFRSYYVDKSVNAVIKHDTNEIEEFVEFKDNYVSSVLNEAKLTTEERKNLPDSEFGIPKDRSYPLNDEEHVRQAIRMFNHCPDEDEKTLAKNIIKKINKFHMTDINVSEDNNFYKYYQVLKEYEYNTSGPFPIELATDYRFKYWDKQADIEKEKKECISLIHNINEYKYVNSMFVKTKFLTKCYYDNEFIGFAMMHKDIATRKLEYGIYIEYDYLNDEDAKLEITKYFIYLIRDYMYQSQTLQDHIESKNKYLNVYSINNDKKLISKLRLSLIQDGSFIDKLTKLNLAGDNNSKDKIKHANVDVDIEKFGQSLKKEKLKVHMSEGNMYPEGIRSGDNIFFFDSDVFNEDFTDSTLRRYIYDERIRTQKELMDVYKVVKSECPSIKFTKVNYNQYKGLNLFFDISYYHKIFLEKNDVKSERGVNLYAETLSRLLNNKNLDKEYNTKTIFIPVMDYFHKDVDIFDFKKSINPISTIIRLIRRNDFDKLKSIFKNVNVIMFGKNSYFKVNFSSFEKNKLSRFISNINNILNNSVPVDDDMTKDSPDAIVTDIVDMIEKSQNINLYGALGKATKVAKKDEEEKESKPVAIQKQSDNKPVATKKEKPVKVKATDENDKPKTEKEVKKEITDKKKEQVIDAIEKAANSSTSTEEALDKLNNDEFLASIIQDIADEESNDIKASSTRKARINSLNEDLMKKEVKGKTIKEMISSSEVVGDKEPLETTSANINSINQDQWDNLQFINFNNDYDVDEDIMAILNFFSSRTVPVGIRDVSVEDTTTPEDLKETWSVQCEDINGTRFNLKFDIPKFKNNRLMRLRGNDKTINGQLMNLPIIKTESDTAQITTNYNKIFFYSFGSALGKSNVASSKLIKALSKYQGKDITFRPGSNTITELKYEIPIDYSDIGNGYSYIKYKEYTFYFDQDEIREKYSDIIDLSKGLPIGYNSKDKAIVYSDGSELCSYTIAKILCQDPKFKEEFDAAKPSVKYAYSQASILNTKIPVIVICAYCEGLIKTLNKAKISYSINDKRVKYDNTTQDVIKFNDAYLVYDINYSSSMFMNGLKECNTEDYSIKDVNTKSMWIEQLDHFGGRIKSDGLDNFYDLMFDPITIRVCEAYNLPSNFCEALIYASDLLSDTKYNKHVDLTGNRLRTNEIIAGYTYKELSKSYADYRTKLKKSGKATMTIKQTAVIDAILQDSTTSDASTINDLCYAEAYNTVSFKGLSGLNSDRSYSLDKRTYDDSMINILGMSTGFAATVGVSRVATANANINGKRGYITDSGDQKAKMNDVNTMTVCENLAPMSTTHDDPFREAMSYVQRTKHDMRVQGGDPMLITNGMDDALSNFTPDFFSFNAKADGRIIERDAEHITIQYKDGSVDYVDLNNRVYKNSDGGFYTSIKLVPSEHLGTTVKKGQLIAYDPMSYTTNIGYDDSATYNQGTFAKVALITSDKGFEDSCIVSRYISDALSSDIVMQTDVVLSKSTNIFNLVKVGDAVQEGDPLLIMQNSYEDNDVNILLKNLVDDEDTVTSLGRIPIKSHNTGVIEDIMIYRTCDLEDMSPSLRKIVSNYEKEKSRIANNIAKYDPVKAKEYSVTKLDQTGKMKNVEDGVLIEIYVSYKDDFSVGDKLIFLGAQKGVAKEVVDNGQEPTSSYRPKEPIDAIASMTSFNKRMCCAPLQYTLANKGLVELDRQVKEIMGIKQDYSIRHKF